MNEMEFFIRPLRSIKEAVPGVKGKMRRKHLPTLKTYP